MKPGRHADGGNLFLLVRDSGARFWVARYMRLGRAHEMGLGPASGLDAVSLVDARDSATDLRRALRSGVDPLAERQASKAALLASANQERIASITFRDEAEGYIAAHAPAWKNDKHAGQWSATLATYAYPVLGKMSVASIAPSDVLKVLQPIWATKPETASRLRGRIEAVLDASKAKGNRDGSNPAAWKGNLAHMLPARGKVKKVRHHSAMPYAKVPGFMTALRQQEGEAARALEFAILTAGRTGEVIGATWGEIDLRKKTWTIPAARMKAGRDHRVPLCARALDIVGKVGSGYLFKGQFEDEPLSNMAMLALLKRMGLDDVTVHGFRSSFRDWVAEQTATPHEVAEMALAHATSDAVVAAYRRSDLFEKRRALADDWAAYCSARQPRAARRKKA